jgi:predicted phosphoadenosine phosphosulfate sulfurtransferase
MGLKQQKLARDVYTVALDRVRECYERFDTVVVAFSGGKDSTVCLQLAIEAARDTGKLPVEVFHFDEECIHPETVEYVARVNAMPEVNLRWLCLPIVHRNACSRYQPYWHPWHPEEKHLWVRELPECAETTHPAFKWGMAIPELVPLLYPGRGLVGSIRGIRADESLRRRRVVSLRETDNWIAGPVGFTQECSPIYDFTTLDVWFAAKLNGWDYNRAYDVMDQHGMAPSEQRVCPPFGEEPLENLAMYAACWPELWHKMVARVPGAATASRYSRTELYGYGGKRKPPDGLTFKEWCFRLIELYPDPWKSDVARNVRKVLDAHAKKTNRPVPEDTPDILTGVSWRVLAEIAARGDFKGRRANAVNTKGEQQAAKQGLSFADVLALEVDIETRY